MRTPSRECVISSTVTPSMGHSGPNGEESRDPRTTVIDDVILRKLKMTDSLCRCVQHDTVPLTLRLTLPEVFAAEFVVERVELLVGVVVDDQRAAALFRRAKPDARAERPLQPSDECLAQRRIAVTLA